MTGYIIGALILAACTAGFIAMCRRSPLMKDDFVGENVDIIDMPGCAPPVGARRDIAIPHENGSSMSMTVDQLVQLITGRSGEIFPFSYAANTMAAHGVDAKLVQYFRDAAERENRASFDRSMILARFRTAAPDAAETAAVESFMRLNRLSPTSDNSDEAVSQ